MDWPCMLSRLPCGRVRSPAAMGDPGGGPARPVRLRRGLLQPKPQCTQPSATSPRAGRETDGELTPDVRQNGRGSADAPSCRDNTKDRSSPTCQGSVQAWTSPWHKALQHLKTARIHKKCRCNPPPDPGRMARAEESGRNSVGKQVLDVAGEPGPGLHLARD